MVVAHHVVGSRGGHIFKFMGALITAMKSRGRNVHTTL